MIAGTSHGRRRWTWRVDPGRGPDERGSVTAELALALPSVVLVLAAVLLTAAAAGVRLQCAEAARAGARAAAIGVDDAAVAAVARQVAGSGATVTVRRDPPWVEVTVTGSVPGSWLSGGDIGLVGVATAWSEP